MPKRYGEPYDPALRKTEHGGKLYWFWKKVRLNTDSKEFESFGSFYEWAMDAGYESGDKFILIDKRKPYSPDNCDWELSPGERLDSWNRTVNQIRKHYGMTPLEE